MSTHPLDESQRGAPTREELLNWANPFPPYEEMIIEGLTDQEEEAFLKAIAEA